MSPYIEDMNTYVKSLKERIDELEDEVVPSLIKAGMELGDENSALKARIAELEAGIKAMYQIDQSQTSRMDVYAMGFNAGYDFAETKAADAIAELEVALVEAQDSVQYWIKMFEENVDGG